MKKIGCLALLILMIISATIAGISYFDVEAITQTKEELAEIFTSRDSFQDQGQTYSISDNLKLYGSSTTSNSANKVTEGLGEDPIKKVLHFQTPQDLFEQNLIKCSSQFDNSSS